MSYRMPDRTIAGIRLNAEQYSRLLEVRGAYIREQLGERLDSRDGTR